MYAYTKSTVLDRTYRYAKTLDITPRDEGAAVFKCVGNRRSHYVGVIINQRLVKAGE